jgi:hypothetical protein
MKKKAEKTRKQEREEKLKILAAGDVHGDTGLARKLAEKAEKEKVDLIILAGDITSPLETEIIKPFKEKRKKVLLIPGNWDSITTVDFLAELYGMRNIHGYSVKYKDVGIFGAGGVTEERAEEKQIFKTLKKGNEALKNVRKKIMVTHMHPSDTKSEFSGFKGSKGIRKAIEKFQPDLLIHSHIHEAEGIEDKIGKTKVINIGKKGKIIEI